MSDLHAALERYGKHDARCIRIGQLEYEAGRCVCGLEQALAAAPASSRFLDLDAPETVERLAAQLMRLYGRSYQTEGIWHPDARAILAALREPAAEDVQAHVSPCRSNQLSPHRWASTCLTTPKPKED